MLLSEHEKCTLRSKRCEKRREGQSSRRRESGYLLSGQKGRWARPA